MRAYYNEIDSYAADWLENLIAAGLIPGGTVDRRSITEVEPDDLEGFTQVHLFAGIGGWAYALALAGWPEDEPVWTGSCPCQPLSSAGQRKGHADERHLWPAFHRLVAERRPAVVLGEQVASKDGREWLAGVRADLEHLGYAVGAADLPAAGVGAPHIRARLWWVADADANGSLDDKQPPDGWRAKAIAEHSGSGGLALPDGGHAGAEGLQRGGQHGQQSRDSGAGRLGDASRTGLQERRGNGRIQREALGSPEGQAAVGTGNVGGLGDAESQERREPNGQADAGAKSQVQIGGSGASFWSAFDLIPCADGKARRVEPGSFPLADGVPNRVGRLRAYGNAIVPQVAAEFIAAYRDLN